MKNIFILQLMKRKERLKIVIIVWCDVGVTAVFKLQALTVRKISKQKIWEEKEEDNDPMKWQTWETEGRKI